MEGSAKKLPAGQVAIADFPRWGLPEFVRRRPKTPADPRLSLGGDVQSPCEIALHELIVLPRYEQVSDLHCVTTWSRCGLRWSGYRMREFYEQIFVPRAHPDPGVEYLVLRALDGLWTSLPLEDVLAPDVLLADRLDGEPLSVQHGAPLRLVAPAHYAFKGVKHLCGVEVVREFVDRKDWRLHPRGRIALEERGQHLPGWGFRLIYRATLPLMLAYYRRLTREGPRPASEPSTRSDIQ